MMVIMSVKLKKAFEVCKDQEYVNCDYFSFFLLDFCFVMEFWSS